MHLASESDAPGEQGESAKADKQTASSEAGADWGEFADLNLVPKAGVGEPSLIVDVDGFEGPLDFLLALARKQKLDLTKISILALAEQYLPIHRASPQAEAGTGSGLSGHGGLASLSQVQIAHPRDAR